MSKNNQFESIAYSVPQLAKLLNIGRNAAYALVNRDDFPAVRISERRIIIPADKLAAWLNRQSQKGGDIE